MTRTRGARNKKETKRKRLWLRLTNRDYAYITILARATNNTQAQIMRSYIEDGLKRDSEKIQKIKALPFYNIYKPNFLVSSSSSSSDDDNTYPFPKDKWVADLSEIHTHLTDQLVTLRREPSPLELLDALNNSIKKTVPLVEAEVLEAQH